VTVVVGGQTLVVWLINGEVPDRFTLLWIPIVWAAVSLASTAGRNTNRMSLVAGASTTTYSTTKPTGWYQGPGWEPSATTPTATPPNWEG
jgi:hypothetical protein